MPNCSRSQVFIGLAAAMILPCGTGHSQTETSPQKFEVASIKPSRFDASGRRFDISPSGAMDVNTTVKSLVQIAYQIQDYQISGDPKWLESEYYRIVAKPPAGPFPTDQKKRMDRTSEMA